ncbi:MAG: 1,4-alpha-glucan branching protein GlgB [Inquilinus sp.]|nr:1,4-alpha-glucan branching protein GlgB [Inquilinus sp.]
MAQPAADAEIDAILGGRHGDPFGFLGMHEAVGGGLVVRSFQPHAAGLELVEAKTGKRLAAFELAHPGGLFVAVLPRRRKPFAYRLRLGAADGSAQEIDDPYRFGPLLGELDIHLLAEGSHQRLYEALGAHPAAVDGVAGTRFAVWAPGAARVSVVGDCNGWDGRRHPMRLHPSCGVWEIFLPGVGPGARYKYEILGADGALLPQKADPVGFQAEPPPRTASVVAADEAHRWVDGDWMARRQAAQSRDAPISIYEVHLASWRRADADGDGQGGRYLSYAELAAELIPYVKELGFTHIELMPVSEYPFDGSWGYQPVGLFAPTSRHGTPAEFQAFVDAAHAAGLGVLVDWVPGHFPTDPHGLGEFDGSHLYEHADPRQGFHQDWNTLIYNYGRAEVSGFLLANALYWLDRFHVDGLRVDAVASMLYLDYSRRPGEWVPNRLGGRENLEAIEFLKATNRAVYAGFPGAITVAEESTAWEGVSRPTESGGLGFGYKWNMGWMNDTLRYMAKEPIHRRFHHHDLTFGLSYGFSENFVLPLSHDETVHGKGSLIGKMPGDEWQKFANLRAYFGFMWSHPGKKLLFMGGEFGQLREWNHDRGLDWHLLDRPFHAGLQRLVRDLNRLYRATPALHRLDCDPGGFEWIDNQDAENSVLSYLRRGPGGEKPVVVVCNFTPTPRHPCRIGVPQGGIWRELINTDATDYGGSGLGNLGTVTAEPVESHGRPHSLVLSLPPLGTLILQPEG